MRWIFKRCTDNQILENDDLLSFAKGTEESFKTSEKESCLGVKNSNEPKRHSGRCKILAALDIYSKYHVHTFHFDIFVVRIRPETKSPSKDKNVYLANF